ncbi:MAG: hypothetical protein ACE5GE_12335 [Phycisphaerae bacterium]
MPTREQLEKLLASEPDDVFLNFGLAMQLAKEDCKDAALAQFRKVTEIDPDYSAGYYHQGRLLLGLGKAPEARDVLRIGVQATQRTGDTHAESEMQELLAEAESN